MVNVTLQRAELSRRLRAFRKNKNILQKVIALDTGASVGSVSRWESPLSPYLPDAFELRLWCLCVDIAPERVLGSDMCLDKQENTGSTLQQLLTAINNLDNRQQVMLLNFLVSLKK